LFAALALAARNCCSACCYFAVAAAKVIKMENGKGKSESIMPDAAETAAAAARRALTIAPTLAYKTFISAPKENRGKRKGK